MRKWWIQKKKNKSIPFTISWQNPQPTTTGFNLEAETGAILEVQCVCRGRRDCGWFVGFFPLKKQGATTRQLIVGVWMGGTCRFQTFQICISGNKCSCPLSVCHHQYHLYVHSDIAISFPQPWNIKYWIQLASWGSRVFLFFHCLSNPLPAVTP